MNKFLCFFWYFYFLLLFFFLSFCDVRYFFLFFRWYRERSSFDRCRYSDTTLLLTKISTIPTPCTSTLDWNDELSGSITIKTILISAPKIIKSRKFFTLGNSNFMLFYFGWCFSPWMSFQASPTHNKSRAVSYNIERAKEKVFEDSFIHS